MDAQAQPEVQIGQKFRKRDVLARVWVVKRQAYAGAIQPHMCMVAHDDPTVFRTWSVSALTDPRMFEPVEEVRRQIFTRAIQTEKPEFANNAALPEIDPIGGSASETAPDNNAERAAQSTAADVGAVGTTLPKKLPGEQISNLRHAGIIKTELIRQTGLRPYKEPLLERTRNLVSKRCLALNEYAQTVLRRTYSGRETASTVG